MRPSLIRRMIMTPLFMPPEWAPHRACLILYPHNTGVFRSDANGVKCGPAREEVRNIARAICYKGYEDVILCCNTEAEANHLKGILAKEEQAPSDCPYRIKVQVCDSDDSWCRDSGPTFVLNTDTGKMVGLDWDFNAYGGPEEGCYWPCDKDRLVAGRMVDIVAKEYNIDVEHVKVPEIILEGGSFHTDGEGTILTTEECLLNPNRNPQLSKDQIEKIVLQKLGAEKMIWLPHGIAFDNDTNGHVDNIATFVRPGEVALSWTNDQSDVNWDRFNAALNVLNKEVDAKGRKIRVHLLHVPDPMVSFHSITYQFCLIYICI